MDNIFKKPWVWIIIVGLLVAGSILYLDTLEVEEGEEVVLRVNGTSFTQSEFDEVASMVRDNPDAYGASTEEEIREEAIGVAVQQTLLLEHASDMGMDPTEEEVEAKIKEMMDVYDLTEEELLEEMQMTRDEAEEYFIMETKVNGLFQYYAEEIDITEEDIEQAYALYSAQQDMPPLDEVAEEINRALLENQVTSILLSKVEEMKEGAQIEVLF